MTDQSSAAADNGASSSAWRYGAAGFGVCSGLVLLHTREFVAPSTSSPTGFAIGTVLMLAVAVLILWFWPRKPILPAASARRSPVGALILLLLTVGLLYAAASRLLPHIFAGPIGSAGGDMLLVIDLGVRRLLSGHNPYVTYTVPWKVWLTYGPGLWMPYSIPILLRADERLLTAITQAYVPAAFGLSAMVAAYWRRFLAAGLLLALATEFALDTSLVRFHGLGHTQVYWPLMIVFAVCLATDRSMAAAVALGLLVSARTTMLAIVPLFLLHLSVQRRLRTRILLTLAACALLPFVPFVLLDPAAVWWAMYTSYATVTKSYLWNQTTGPLDTYGLTGVLLRHGEQEYVEAAQLAVLMAFYVMARWALKRGVRPEPLAAAALLLFSMTVFWPVLYLYFDVWLLFAAGFAAVTLSPLLRSKSAPIALAVPAFLSIFVVLVVGAGTPGRRYVIDVGTSAAAPLTGGGFGQDASSRDGDRTFVWVEGTRAVVRLPRAGWGDSELRVVVRPYVPMTGYHQRIIASLNGRPIGTVDLIDDWQEVALHAPAAEWRYGFNLLELYMTYSEHSPPSDSSGRSLSIAVDRIVVD